MLLLKTVWSHQLQTSIYGRFVQHRESICAWLALKQCNNTADKTQIAVEWNCWGLSWTYHFYGICISLLFIIFYIDLMVWLLETETTWWYLGAAPISLVYWLHMVEQKCDILLVRNIKCQLLTEMLPGCFLCLVHLLFRLLVLNFSNCTTTQMR